MEFSSLQGFTASPVSPAQLSSFSAKSWPHCQDVKSGLVDRLDLTPSTPKPAHGSTDSFQKKTLSQFPDHIPRTEKSILLHCPWPSCLQSPRSCWTPSRAQAASQHQSCFLHRGPLFTSKVTFQLLWRSEIIPAGFWPVWGLHLCLAPIPCSSSSISRGAGQGMKDSGMKWLRLSWIISSLG